MTEVAVKSTVPFVNLGDKSVAVEKRKTGRFANWCLDVGQKRAYTVTDAGKVGEIDRAGKDKPNGWLVALKILLLATVVFAIVAAIARNVFLNANKFKVDRPTPPSSPSTSPSSSPSTSPSSSRESSPISSGTSTPTEAKEPIDHFATVSRASEVLREGEESSFEAGASTAARVAHSEPLHSVQEEAVDASEPILEAVDTAE